MSSINSIYPNPKPKDYVRTIVAMFFVASLYSCMHAMVVGDIPLFLVSCILALGFGYYLKYLVS